jgi:hypothetical protein
MARKLIDIFAEVIVIDNDRYKSIAYQNHTAVTLSVAGIVKQKKNDFN